MSTELCSTCYYFQYWQLASTLSLELQFQELHILCVLMHSWIVQQELY